MVDPETYEHELDVLAGHCEWVGRDYDEIEKTVLLFACNRPETEAAHDAYEDLAGNSGGGPMPRGGRLCVGSPAEVANTVETYRDLGVEGVMIPVPRNDEETIERFADEVAPEFA